MLLRKEYHLPILADRPVGDMHLGYLSANYVFDRYERSDSVVRVANRYIQWLAETSVQGWVVASWYIFRHRLGLHLEQICQCFTDDGSCCGMFRAPVVSGHLPCWEQLTSLFPDAGQCHYARLGKMCWQRLRLAWSDLTDTREYPR